MKTIWQKLGGLILGGAMLLATAHAATSTGVSPIFTVDTRTVGIATPPQSQTTNAGANMTFTVTVAGVPPFGYQWQFNGQNIPNATNATLTLNSVTAANSGGYSVVVSNPYGSVTSATASLAVLDDGANGNTPTPITPTPIPSKPSGVKNLVFVTHGWQSVLGNLGGPPSQPWMVEMTNDIVQQLAASGQASDWQVEAYYWLQDAWTLVPDQALHNANSIGTQLGQQFAAQDYQFVHLIAHSAGSEMIQTIANILKSSPHPPTIQLTFSRPVSGFACGRSGRLRTKRQLVGLLLCAGRDRKLYRQPNQLHL